jgi:putative membrane protein
MRPRCLVASIAVLAAIAGGCEKKPDTSTTETTSATEARPAATQALSNDDKEFMTEAARGGALEVKLGRMATERAASPDVKAFGQRLANDHQKANDELTQLARRRDIVLPADVAPDKQELIGKLSKLDGPRFDAKYVDEVVDDHEDDVEEFREATKELKDPELRAWATRTLPVLEAHLAKAKELHAKYGH